MGAELDGARTDDRALRRRAAVQRLGILDGAAALGLDKAARLARFIAGSRYAAVHLLDVVHQHPVGASAGTPPALLPIEATLCVKVVEAEQTIATSDATLDPRFAGHPAVTRDDPVRFYSGIPLRDDEGVVVGTLCVWDERARALDEDRLVLLGDVADQVAQHLQLHRLATELAHTASHDVLTGLANRRLLSDRLAHAMNRRDRRAGHPALALVDLDGFKGVNDRYGHAAGDAVLREVARRLQSAVRREDTVARIGGDEFVVLYEQLPDDLGPEVLTARLCAAFAEPMAVGDERLGVRASIGMVVAEPEELGYELLGRADQSMYVAKAVGARVADQARSGAVASSCPSASSTAR